MGAFYASAMQHHIVEYGVRYSCTDCEYQTTKGSHLKAHKDSVHQGINYPACRERKYNLERHQTTHTGHIQRQISVKDQINGSSNQIQEIVEEDIVILDEGIDDLHEELIKIVEKKNEHEVHTSMTSMGSMYFGNGLFDEYSKENRENFEESKFEVSQI